MKVRITEQSDAPVGKGKALFVGQVYDLPDDVASALIDDGKARAVQAKAIDGPESDKARKKKTTK